MKITVLMIPLVLLAACTTNPKLALTNTDSQLCGNHKADYQFFRAAFDKEYTGMCANGCAYTPTMTKNSDTMERIAGNYYLMNCDINHGRL